METNRLDGSRLIQQDGRVLGYAENGDPAGTPVTGFHGTPGSRLMMKAVEKAEIASGVRIIAPERPGYGLSQASPDGTLLGYIGDVVELADALGFKRFAVIGISGGGPYALACAYQLQRRSLVWESLQLRPGKELAMTERLLSEPVHPERTESTRWLPRFGNRASLWCRQAYIRGFLILNVLIALTVAGIGCSSGEIEPPATLEPVAVHENAVVTPEADEWKLFSSREHGFEFRYPESCGVAELGESLNVGGRIELTILESEGLGLSDYVNRFADNRARNSGWTIESIRSGLVGGQEAMTVEYRFGGPKRFGTATFALRNGKVYIWGLTAGGFTCDEPNVYGPILSSFRFIR